MDQIVGEAGTVQPELFRQGMRSLFSGVCIISTIDGGERVGLVASSVTSVSMEPPTLLVCINKNASAHDVVMRSGVFAITILAENHAEIARIFNLRRTLMKFKKLLGPMAQVTSALEHHDLPCIDTEVRAYFRDVRDHIQRTEILVDGLREVLTSVFEIASLLEQQRQGVITRQLAAWAAILAVPTAIAGVDGMTFEHMPELKWADGYPTVLAGIAVICGLL